MVTKHTGSTKLKSKLLKDPLLSVIIVTRNRPQKLLQALEALSQNSFSDYEVIVIDQSNDESAINLNQKTFLRQFSRFRLIRSKQNGKSKGLNQVIGLSTALLVAFTDDDCLPDQDWLYEINQTFSQYPHIAGIFGKTLPYNPENNIGYTCPSVFQNNIDTIHIIDQPGNHWERIGFGNNMAFRKLVFEELGNFKEWLGPGSIGSNAEDAEYALRVLLSGKKLLYNPKMIVYHNRWLNDQEMRRQELSYICGELSCYGYFALKGHRFAKQVVKDNLRESFYTEPKNLLYLLAHCKKNVFTACYWWFLKILARGRGITVAVLYLSMENIFSWRK
jgi:GT2 family glycosyltransferase